MCIPYGKTFLMVPYILINFDHVTLTVTFDLHLENFNSAHNFLTIRHGAFIFGVCDLSGGNISFDHMTVIVTFDLLSNYFNMAPNCFTLRYRAIIFDTFGHVYKTRPFCCCH